MPDEKTCEKCAHFRWIEDVYDDGSYTDYEYCDLSDAYNYRKCSYGRPACECFEED